MPHSIEMYEPEDASESAGRVLVWDAPVRVFHWLMVLSFAGAYLTADSERWRLLHITLGYTMGGLVAFRLVWGLVGTRYARFTTFVKGPRAVKRYLATMWSAISLIYLPRTESVKHHLDAVLEAPAESDLGHNPVGAIAIVLLLLFSAVLVGTGWAVYNDVGSYALVRLHEAAAIWMLVLAVGHVVGVLWASWQHDENLVRAMVDGKKSGLPAQGIAHCARVLALGLALAVLAFWGFQFLGMR